MPEPEDFAEKNLPASNYPKTPPHSPLTQYFAFAHLKPDLQEISKPFHDLAQWMLSRLEWNVEREEMMRKLLEAKDCAVRARLFKQ